MQILARVPRGGGIKLHWGRQRLAVWPTHGWISQKR